MTKTNLTLAKAIESGELAYYYFMYELTQDHNCEQCPFKMGYDPSGLDTYKEAVNDYKHSRQS